VFLDLELKVATINLCSNRLVPVLVPVAA